MSDERIAALEMQVKNLSNTLEKHDKKLDKLLDAVSIGKGFGGALLLAFGGLGFLIASAISFFK